MRIRAFSDYFKNARYIDAYGLTETCGGDTFMEAGREIEKIGSTGRAIAHVEIEIRDDAGNRLPPGAERRNLPARTEGHARLLERSREDRGRRSSATGSAAATSAISTRTASSI